MDSLKEFITIKSNPHNPLPMEALNIVIVGQQPWDTPIGSNCKDIALELSKRHRVLYVNSPLDRITSIREKSTPEVATRLAVIGGGYDGLVELGPNLYNLYPDKLVESINFLPSGAGLLFDFINRRNNFLFARSIKKALKRLGFDQYILFNDNEIIKTYYLDKLLKPRLSIYYSRDYILATPYWRKHGRRLEPKVIAKYDVCVANSTYLMDYCAQYNPNSYYIGQGCDLSHFHPNLTRTKPEDLANITGPLIGYVGALQSIRLDLAILRYIATARPDWSIVLVGPEDEVFQQSDLHQLENVHFLGLKPMDQLPQYIAYFDVCINPQLLNEMTIGNYPRKVDEYLAMGKPVVATRTRAMDVFEETTYLAESPEEYVTLIQKAMDEDQPALQQARHAFASKHTWEASVRQLEEVIDKHLPTRL
jgi:teichuronic acid biosynthesis glycosyltransferase TuaH